MLSVNLVWLIASVATACLSGYALKRYINRKTSNPQKIVISNKNPLHHVNPMNSNPFNPLTPAAQSFDYVPMGYTAYRNFEKLLEQVIARNLLSTRTNITLELPEDAEIELLGKKWKVKAGSKIRIGTPRKTAKPKQSNPLDEFFRRGERK